MPHHDVGGDEMTKAFRDDIQGLRALAIVPVVLYHASHNWAPGGFVGVDIFFVISGYLISGILLREMASGSYSIRNFYRRRALRIFPALYLVLLVCLVAGAGLLAPDQFRELGATIAGTATFSSNFLFERISDYFAGDSETKPLLHTWSLAVEEQFYILYPPLLYFGLKHLRKYLFHICAVLILASLSADVVTLLLKHTITAFYMTPYRAFELLIGCALTTGGVPEVSAKRLRETLTALGLALIVGSIVLLNSNTPFPGFAALLPCLGAALIIHAGHNGTTAVGRALSTPVPVFFGAISYSLYLWHWPILVYLKHLALGEPTALQVVAALMISVVVAFLSLKFVERPLIKAKASNGLVFGLSAAAIAISVIAGTAIFLSHGVPQRFGPAVRALSHASMDYNPRRNACHSNEGRPIAYRDNCVFGAPGAVASTAVWADSFGVELSVALGEIKARSQGAVEEITASSCPPSLGYQPIDRPYCRIHNLDTLNALIADNRIKEVVMAANFQAYPRQNWNEVATGFEQSARRLAAAGKSIVLVYPIPKLPYDGPAGTALTLARGRDPAAFGTPRAQADADAADAILLLNRLSAEVGARTIVPTDRLCDTRACHAYIPSVGGLYFNQDHLSLTGARLVLRDYPGPI
jgi:peptidoglycan/LPS O-acetylase OafA/YrhL